MGQPEGWGPACWGVGLGPPFLLVPGGAEEIMGWLTVHTGQERHSPASQARALRASKPRWADGTSSGWKPAVCRFSGQG